MSSPEIWQLPKFCMFKSCGMGGGEIAFTVADMTSAVRIVMHVSEGESKSYSGQNMKQ